MATSTRVTRVVMNPETVAALEGGLAEGVLNIAEDGKRRALDHAARNFRTTRRFQSNAFATAYKNRVRIGGSGDEPGHAEHGGIVGYFGFNWFVARFYETGTVKHRPRPSIGPAASEIGASFFEGLRAAIRRRGFR